MGKPDELTANLNTVSQYSDPMTDADVHSLSYPFSKKGENSDTDDIEFDP